MKSYTSWFSHISPAWWRRGALVLAAGLIVALAPFWWARFNALADRIIGNPPTSSDDSQAHEDDHNHGHDHEHAPAIRLSEAARKNIGLVVREVQPQSFQRSMTVPALVTERPGESRYTITAPITGIVTGLHVVPGELVESSALLFTLRLTHEDLVNAQKEFLATLGRLDVEQREVERLRQINTNAMSRRVILEKEYEVEKLEASLNAQRNALHLHGLNAEQISRIEEQRTLIREMKVSVPFLHEDASVHGDEEAEHHLTDPSASHEEHELIRQEFLIQQLAVQPGQAVETGQLLCHLSNDQTLYIEGRAFEQDAQAIVEAARNRRKVAAIPEGYPGQISPVENLDIVRVANGIENDSRALHFYVELPNEMEQQSQSGKRRYVTWRYKPGQRMQLRVPVEEWQDVFVLPVEAVAQEGPETFVFVENGDQLERREVHVTYRDQFEAVIANDGSLFPQEAVAQNAAHQLQMAIKNEASGGGGDHHGHMH